ncbi:hypothetical protein ACVSUJ_21050 [Yersinia enterocolitica]
MSRPCIREAQLQQVLRAVRDAGLTPTKAQKLLVRIAKYGLIPAAKRHVKAQQTPDDVKWAPRKKTGKQKGKRKAQMLAGMPKLLAIKNDKANKSVRLYFKAGDYATRTHGGVVAWAQQHGTRITMKASSLQRRYRSDALRKKPATSGQAERLLSLGFRAPVGAVSKKTGHRGRRKPSKKWIIEHMNMAQAGLVIDILKGKSKRSTWEIVLPSRAFLGASGEEFARILETQLRNLNYGTNT